MLPLVGVTLLFMMPAGMRPLLALTLLLMARRRRGRRAELPLLDEAEQVVGGHGLLDALDHTCEKAEKELKPCMSFT